LKGRALPTIKEGKYIDTIKDKGALKDIFARHSDSSSPAGYVWLAEPSTISSINAWCQEVRSGGRSAYYRGFELAVLSVREMNYWVS
jgi:hypothetical protein